MEIFHDIKSLQKQLNLLRSNGKTIGFVPTMGALHNGHLSLVHKAKAQCDISVCSIFVNPTQFNEKSDLDKYPRTLEADQKLLQTAANDIIFAPSANEMYPDGTAIKHQFDFGYLVKPMEGATRPGHFEGMAQVVNLLLDIVQPDALFMGQKDYQQVAIVRRLLKLTNKTNIKLVMCDIIRDEDGLAMSSRNRRITAENRTIASQIHKTLIAAKHNRLEYTIDILKQWAMESLSMMGFKPIYFEFVDAETLKPVKDLHNDGKGIVACVAAWLGEVRLIDNMIIS